MTDTPTLTILRAVNDTYNAIRVNHSELPDIVFVVGATGKARRGQVHGHFYPKGWHGDQHEIMLSGESLARGPVATLGTILHEAAHASAHVQDVRDTSNNGRYHNTKFRSIAEKFGLVLDQAPTVGWSLTSVPDETQEQYREQIEALTEALVTWRESPVKDETEKKPRKSTKVKIHCSCADSEVSVSAKWWEKMGPALHCEDCLENYEQVEEDNEST